MKDGVVERLYRHVQHLSVRIGERHLWKGDSLREAADYIESVFLESGYAARRQTYTCYGKQVSNIIAEKVGTGGPMVVVGAHYDTVPGTPGADDNASGVAGLLELARLHAQRPIKKHLVFAAFANEEPPCFGSPNMGSMVYAKSLRDLNAPLDFMICLEMIGYFSPQGRQDYPLPFFRWLYPATADFLAIAGDFHSARSVSLLKRGIRKHTRLPVRSIVAPRFFGGIGLSDNSSFWRYGYRAVMATDTSFFRNKHYHQESDAIETLHFESMAEVVMGLHGALAE